MRRRIQQFGQRLGLQDFDLDDSGVAALELEGAGTLRLETAKQGHELLFYLTYALEPTHEGMAEKALDISHYRYAHPCTVWAGVYKEQLVLVTKLAEMDVTAQSLENTAQFLLESMDRLLH